MQIEVCHQPKDFTVGNVQNGDMFEYIGQYFLRLPYDCNVIKTTHIPVYNVSKNLTQHMPDPNVKVTPVNAKIVIT